MLEASCWRTEVLCGAKAPRRVASCGAFLISSHQFRQHFLTSVIFFHIFSRSKLLQTPSSPAHSKTLRSDVNTLRAACPDPLQRATSRRGRDEG